MSGEAARWRRVTAILHRVLEASAGAREAILDRECGDDPDLRADVGSLLVHLEAMGDFAERPAIAALLSGPALEPLRADGERVLEPGDRVGACRVVAFIGRGGMGEVYRAVDTQLDRQVAIKVLSAPSSAEPQRLTRFLREARILASLNHPNIGAAYSLERTDDGHPALVLELVEGVTLAERLRDGKLAVRETVDIALQVALALEAAHARGIVHRDLKPSNIALRADGVVKVLDFGLARTTAPIEGETASATRSGILVGTAAYMAPEQASSGDVDARADVWSFGCVVFEMLTGVSAFAGSDLAATILNVLASAPSWDRLPAGLPRPLADALRRSLEKDAGARVASIADMRVALELARARRDAPEPDPLPPLDTQVVSAGHGVARVPSHGRARRLVPVVTLGVLVAVVIWLLRGGTGGLIFQAPPPGPVHRQVTFTGDVRDAAVSPDGGLVAYATGKRILLRGVSEESAFEVARSEGEVWGLRWSPRGDQLAFIATDVTGTDTWVHIVTRLGAARRFGPGRAAEWSPDGSRLALYGHNIGIVDATDFGRWMKPPDLGDSARYINSVAWHPQLDRLAFTQMAPDGRSEIWSVALDGDSPQRIYLGTEAVGSLHWSPAGRILYFVRAQGPAAEVVAIDATRSAQVPRVVLSGLPPIGSLSITADGRFLVHARGPMSRNLARQEIGREGVAAEPISRGTRWLSAARVSPDGEWIAALDGMPPRSHLVRLSVAGGEPVPVIPEDQYVGVPAWSPDGNSIAFASTRGGTPGVWVVRADGTGLRRVQDAVPSSNLLTAWTRDGRVMWQDNVSRMQMNFRIEAARGDEPDVLMRKTMLGSIFDPVFSPRGDAVAIYWNRADDEGKPGVYVVSWPSREPRLLCDAFLFPMAWTPDGAAVIAKGADGAWRIDAYGGERRRIQQAENVSDISQDGKYLVTEVESRNWDVWMVEHFDPLVPAVSDARPPGRPSLSKSAVARMSAVSSPSK